MTYRFHPRRNQSAPQTWDGFRRAIRKVDRDTLLIEAAGATAAIARGEFDENHAKSGLTPWTIGDVARTALAWARFNRPEADAGTLMQLCNQNIHIVDEGLLGNPESTEGLGQVLSRLYFEQFPSQTSVMASVARALLLFGSAAEHPQDFSPKAMTPGWFEAITGGLTLDDYVEAVFLITVMTQSNGGRFSLSWLEGSAFEGLKDVISFDVLRRVFTEHLVTNVTDFKAVNRTFQEHLPPAQKKFAFNPLAATPFIEGVAPIPIAPWGQAIIRKASPPAIYHLGLRKLGGGFADDLGAVFQHYVGRQLALVHGEVQVVGELKHGPQRERKDSCDWFLDLPGMLVLVECKARQPIESLRIGGSDWMSSVSGSIGHAIRQLNRSSDEFESICAEEPRLDPGKPRVGLVVTLEPFYVTQNWILAEQLPMSDMPVAVLSVGELETLVALSAGELESTLAEAASGAEGRLMRFTHEPAAVDKGENALLATTWDSIDLFARVESAKERLQD
ncbi:hypothetical protein Slu03_05960 [Sediminihabitans luteus]|nr:hypothetical protein Slu03_05960 [Sediminihabitans luteus]